MTDLLDEYKQMTLTIKNVNRLLDDFNKHYSNDNIALRDKWMKEVNEHILDSEKRNKTQDALMRELNKKLDENNAATLSILIENKRSAIIDFASKVINEDYPVTKEQFNRIFKIYREYEEIIHSHELTNGEVDIAIHIIRESYEQHMKNHTFIEDVRGYNV
jgi:DNA-binding response OmpR family regulator